MRIFSYIIICTLFFSSCWSNPKPKYHGDSVELEDVLLVKSERRHNAELSILDSLSRSWNWQPDTLSGGTFVQTILDSSSAKNSLSDEIILNIVVKLANGNLCFKNDSLHLVVGYYDGPQVFNDISTYITLGDSIHALVPSNMGFGVRGLPGYVPPGSMLLVEASQPIR